MLTFVGLGLFDKDDISLKGLTAVKEADRVYLEAYTSQLTGTRICELEELYGKRIIVLSRNDIEHRPVEIIEEAKDSDVVLLVGGDPMVSTTHADLRIRAGRAGIETSIIHASSISSAVCGLTGLQNYRFGKSCSQPFPAKGWFPTTPMETIRFNIANNLHTLIYLDIQDGRYMTIAEAVELLEEQADRIGCEVPATFVAIARAGSARPIVAAGDSIKMKSADFGSPLHIIAVPAELHPVEREYLETFAGL